MSLCIYKQEFGAKQGREYRYKTIYTVKKRIGFEMENKLSLTFMNADKIYNISFFTEHTETEKK